MFRRILVILTIFLSLTIYINISSAEETKVNKVSTNESDNNTLGTMENPVKCLFITGEEEYLKRLIGPDGKSIKFNRLGMSFSMASMTLFSHYVIESQDGSIKKEIWMDNKHQDYIEEKSIKGFTIKPLPQKVSNEKKALAKQPSDAKMTKDNLIDKLMKPAAELGTIENPVKCFMAIGEEAYLKRLRGPDGKPVKFKRSGSNYSKAIGKVLDHYFLESQDGSIKTDIWMDCYCQNYIEKKPIKGFTIIN